MLVGEGTFPAFMCSGDSPILLHIHRYNRNREKDAAIWIYHYALVLVHSTAVDLVRVVARSTEYQSMVFVAVDAAAAGKKRGSIRKSGGKGGRTAHLYSVHTWPTYIALCPYGPICIVKVLNVRSTATRYGYILLL